jgi:hypothetical protein
MVWETVDDSNIDIICAFIISRLGVGTKKDNSKLSAIRKTHKNNPKELHSELEKQGLLWLHEK